MAKTQAKGTQILDDSITGADLATKLGFYDETKSYVADDEVWWLMKTYKVKTGQSITSGVSGDLSNSPDLDTTNWELYIPKEWEIYFETVEAIVELLHEDATVINSVSLGNASSLQYSIDNGSNWNTPSFPVSLSANSTSKWRVTVFNTGHTDGTIIIKGKLA